MNNNVTVPLVADIRFCAVTNKINLRLHKLLVRLCDSVLVPCVYFPRMHSSGGSAGPNVRIFISETPHHLAFPLHSRSTL